MTLERRRLVDYRGISSHIGGNMFWFGSSLPKEIKKNSSVADIYRQDVTVKTRQSDPRQDNLVVLDADQGSYFFLASSSKCGSFANVFRGLDSRGHRRAIRALKLPGHPGGLANIGHDTQKGDVSEIVKEISAENAAATQVSSFAMFHDKQEHNLYFIMPYAEASGRDIFESVAYRCSKLAEDTGLLLRASIGKTLVLDLARDLKRLAELKVAHNDIKPANFLWFKHAFHLSDFGAITPNDATRIHVSTPTYRAPEQFLAQFHPVKQSYPTETSDIFCLGISACEVVTGARLLFFNEIKTNYSEITAMKEFRSFRTVNCCSPVYFAHFQFVWTRLFQADPILGGHIAEMLNIDPTGRPSAAQLIRDLTPAPPIGNATGQEIVDALLDSLPHRNDDLGFSEVYQAARDQCKDITEKYKIKRPLTMAQRERV
jgi:serine/threonine protein kinase